MPVCVGKRGKIWRIIECATGKIVKNKSGTAVDGNGHKSKDEALAQARAINISLSEKS